MKLLLLCMMPFVTYAYVDTEVQQLEQCQEEELFLQEVDNIISWWGEERHRDIRRPYTAHKVASLRGVLGQDYPSSAMAMKAWRMFKKMRTEGRGDYSHTFGALDPVQVIEMAEHLTSVYVSGWQCSATASSSNEPGPDFADYPMDTVPKKVQQLFEAQRFHDRKQRELRSRLTSLEKAVTPAVDYLRPIIADADTGHGGLTAVMKLTKMFIQNGAAGIHLEDQKPGTKKCGHMSGKVLVSTQEHCDRLTASRLQADIMGSDLLLVARTDAEAANLLDTNIDPRDHAFILGTSNAALPALADLIRIATDKFERKESLQKYEDQLEAITALFPTLGSLIKDIWDSQDLISGADMQGLTCEELETMEKTAINALAADWLQQARLTTYYDAVRQALEGREELLSRWKIANDPLAGVSLEGEPLNALSHKEAVAIAQELGVDIAWDWDSPRTFEGYYQIKGGIDMSIARARAFAPYADLLWMESAAPYMDEAEQFARGVQRLCPNTLLAYNLSPSFNWDKFGMTDQEIAAYQDQLGALGYVWQFITLAGFHGDALFAKSFAKDFSERKMLAYVQNIQRKEREHKVGALTHQQWSGVELIGSQQDAATDYRSSTGANGAKSTEHQFTKAPPM